MIHLSSQPIEHTKETHCAPQLPVSWYTDPAIYALEEKHLFQKSAKYWGHGLMTPNQGDFYALGWMQDAKALVHNQQGISLMSNI